MKKLVVSAFIEEGTLRVRLNDKMIIDGNGDFESTIQEKSFNLLTWYVEGIPKSNYRITVSSPSESSLQINKSVGAKGKDTGYHNVES